MCRVAAAIPALLKPFQHVFPEQEGLWDTHSDIRQRVRAAVLESQTAWAGASLPEPHRPSADKRGPSEGISCCSFPLREDIFPSLLGF